MPLIGLKLPNLRSFSTTKPVGMVRMEFFIFAIINKIVQIWEYICTAMSSVIPVPA